MAKIPAGLSLMKGEKTIYYGRMSWLANFWLLLFGILFIWIGIGLIFLIIAALRVYGSEYFVSNRRVYVKYGVISRRTWEARMEWVTDVSVYQGFIARALNFGNLVISTPSGPVRSIRMIGVRDPMYVRDIVLKWIDKLKEIKSLRDRLARIEEEYELGRITTEKYRELKEKYEKEILKLESEV